MCKTCPVPDIQMANACREMLLQPRLERSFPFLRKAVQVSVFCQRSGRKGFDPHTGCGECHTLPTVFTEKTL